MVSCYSDAVSFWVDTHSHDPGLVHLWTMCSIGGSSWCPYDVWKKVLWELLEIQYCCLACLFGNEFDMVSSTGYPILWERQILKENELTSHTRIADLSFPLDNFQTIILNNFIHSLILREYYDQQMIADEEFCDPDEEHEPSLCIFLTFLTAAISTGGKFTLVTGEAGSGKSQMVCASTRIRLESPCCLPNRYISTPVCI
jgi:hypothetical protein